MVGRRLVLLSLFLGSILAPLGSAEAVLHILDPMMAGRTYEGRLQIIEPEDGIRGVRGLPEGIQLTLRGQAGVHIVNGETSHIYLLTIRIAKAGRYRLDRLVAVGHDGGHLPIPPLTLEALEPADIREHSGEIRVTPPAVVTGQRGELSIRIYTRSRLRDLGPPKDWKPTVPEGIEVEGTPSLVYGEAMDPAGHRWLVSTWTWSVLALRPGAHRVTGQLPLGRYQRVGRRVAFTTVRQIPLRPATWRVSRVPERGRPEDYTGLVGEVRITGTLDRTRIAEGEGCSLRLLVHSPQTDLIRQPTIPSSPTLQVYPQEDRARMVDATTRAFVYDLIPSGVGQHEIPPVSLSWYDLDDGTYRQAVMNPLVLTVVPGRRRRAQVTGAVDPEAGEGPEVLPPPLGGDGAAAVPRWLLLVALVAGLCGGAVAGCLLDGRRPRLRRRRGRRIRRLLADGDYPTTYRLLNDLRDHHPEAEAAIAALRRELEHRQFGGREGDLEALLAPVERLP